MKGLQDFLLDRASLIEGGFCFLNKGYYSPAYFVMLAATLENENVSAREFDNDPEITSYLSTVGLAESIWGVQGQVLLRPNEGRSYSRLIKLANSFSTDTATSNINSCIRTFFSGLPQSSIGELCHVVGEMHDNVWAHGNATGFSMAQKWKVPHKNDYYFEFAVADRGMGFLGELRRARIPVSSDKDAIDWCILEGNSSKLSELGADDWAQSLPVDFLGATPSTHYLPTRNDGSHHQGLGLAHLVRLVEKYSGYLNIVSGTCHLILTESGNRLYRNYPSPWQGVAISCRLKESNLARVVDEQVDSELESIMNQLGGSL